MKIPHLSRAALSTTNIGRNEAEAHPGVDDLEEGKLQHGEMNKGKKSVIGVGTTLLGLRRQQSPLLLHSGSEIEYEVGSASQSLNSPKDLHLRDTHTTNSGKQKWALLPNRSFFTKFKQQYPKKFWICITGIVIMVLTTVLLSTLLVLLHAGKAHSKQDFTVDLGYSKYVGVQANDNNIVKWLGVRFAAPPTGNNRFRAPQPPVVDGKTVQANAVSSLNRLECYTNQKLVSPIVQLVIRVSNLLYMTVY
jgi:hypothetical protein